MTGRALLGIELIGSNLEHIVALNADAIEEIAHDGTGGAGGFLSRLMLVDDAAVGKWRRHCAILARWGTERKRSGLAGSGSVRILTPIVTIQKIQTEPLLPRIPECFGSIINNGIMRGTAGMGRRDCWETGIDVCGESRAALVRMRDLGAYQRYPASEEKARIGLCWVESGTAHLDATCEEERLKRKRWTGGCETGF